MKHLLILMIFGLISLPCLAEMIDHCSESNIKGKIDINYVASKYDDSERADVSYTITAAIPLSSDANELVGVTFQRPQEGIIVPLQTEKKDGFATTEFKINKSSMVYTYISAYYGDDKQGCPISLKKEVKL